MFQPSLLYQHYNQTEKTTDPSESSIYVFIYIMINLRLIKTATQLHSEEAQHHDDGRNMHHGVGPQPLAAQCGITLAKDD